MQAEIVQLEEFLEQAKANEPLWLNVSWGPPVLWAYDGHEVNFGYMYDPEGPIVEWGMDYGDGNSLVAAAQEDVSWHEYSGPGSYVVRAWVVDSSGRRGDAQCTVNWHDFGRGSSGDDDDDYDDDSGDLDCEDIGDKVWVVDDDPNQLDGDGDGYGCDAW